jgi:hypothetical protein
MFSKTLAVLTFVVFASCSSLRADLPGDGAVSTPGEVSAAGGSNTRGGSDGAASPGRGGAGGEATSDAASQPDVPIAMTPPPDAPPPVTDTTTSSPPGCEPGFHLCEGKCSDDRAPATCGTFCTPCPGIAGGEASCEAGTCGVKCPAGKKACLTTNACIGVDEPCSGTCANGLILCNGRCLASNVLPAESCNNGQDDDCDGKVDCADTGCTNGTSCGPNRICQAGSCVAACGDPPSPMCCEGATMPCTNNCGTAGTQTCRGGRYGACSVANTCCGSANCANNCGMQGTKACNGTTWGGCSAPNRQCCADKDCGVCSRCDAGKCVPRELGYATGCNLPLICDGKGACRIDFGARCSSHDQCLFDYCQPAIPDTTDVPICSHCGDMNEQCCPSATGLRPCNGGTTCVPCPDCVFPNQGVCR